MPKVFDHCYRCGTDDPDVLLPKSGLCRPCLKIRNAEIALRGRRVYTRCGKCGTADPEVFLPRSGMCRVCLADRRQQMKERPPVCFRCHAASGTRGGYCPNCANAAARGHHARHRDQHNDDAVSYYWRNREDQRAKSQARRRRLKQEALNAYGGRCACCGEDRWEFLALDHINGLGKQHRIQASGVGAQFYRWLAKQAYPQGDLRVLCHCCNMSLGMYGYCPHRPELSQRASTGVNLAHR